MSELFKVPVRLTDDFIVVDAENRTVLPDITWKPDLDHIERQKAVGNLIVLLLNDFVQTTGAKTVNLEAGTGTPPSDNFCVEGAPVVADTTLPVPPPPNGNGKFRFFKGMKQPPWLAGASRKKKK